MSNMTSEVKFYNAGKGYGFIRNPEGGQDIFVHAEDVRQAGHAALIPHQRISFELAPTPRGFKAVNIRGGNCPYCHGTGRGEQDVGAEIGEEGT